MFWNNKKQKQIGGLQTQLQSEDNNFHRTMIALERLEMFLNKNRGTELLNQTAVGTTRDLHDDTKNPPTYESYILELSLQCNTLFMAASYDDKEIFEAAVEAFMNDLLEWYAGRELLDFYDEVDTSIIPIIVAITRSANVFEVFEKYVSHVSLEKKSSEDGYNQTKSGVEAWILGQHFVKQQPINQPNDGYITSHKRGEALEGYKRVIKALCVMCDDSAPVKMFYKLVNQYLPHITQQLPDTNEESIDRLFDLKTKGFADVKGTDVESVSLSTLYPLLQDAVKEILDKHNIKYSEINIEVK